MREGVSNAEVILKKLIQGDEAVKDASTIVYCWGGETGRRTWGQEGLEKETG